MPDEVTQPEQVTDEIVDLTAIKVNSEAARKLLRRIGSVFTCVICGLFAWYSYQFVVLDYQDEIIAFGRVPAWICEAIMPLGGAVMSFRYLLHVFRPA